MDARRKQMLSIGRRMPGMADWGQNSSSGISPSSSLRTLIREHAKERGSPLRILVKDGKLENAPLSLGVSGWESQLDAMSKQLPANEPCYALIFRDSDTLLITYVPELVKPRDKMLYASSKHSLKVCMSEQVEEINASTLSEISYAEYERRQNVEAPLSEAEKLEAQYATMETGGSYSLLARIMGGNGEGAVGLPGLAKGAVPAFLSKHKEEEEEEGDEDESEKPEQDEDVVEENEDGNSDGDAAQEADVEKDHKDDEEERAKRETAAKAFQEAQEIRERLKQRRSKRVSMSRKEKEKISSVFAASVASDDAASEAKASKSKEKKSKSKKSSSRNSLRASKRYSLAKLVDLKSSDPSGLDLAHLERSLTSKSFAKHFGMEREEFDKLPTWRQIRLKQKVGLF